MAATEATPANLTHRPKNVREAKEGSGAGNTPKTEKIHWAPFLGKGQLQQPHSMLIEYNDQYNEDWSLDLQASANHVDLNPLAQS